MSGRAFWFAVLCILLLCPRGPVFASDNDPHGLSDLPGAIAVVVESLSTDAQALGISTERVLAVAAPRLGKAGLTVADEGLPALRIELAVAAVRGAGLYAFSVRVGLARAVRLAGAPEVEVPGETWRASHTGTAMGKSSADAVLGTLERMVDLFVNDLQFARGR